MFGLLTPDRKKSLTQEAPTVPLGIAAPYPSHASFSGDEAHHAGAPRGEALSSPAFLPAMSQLPILIRNNGPLFISADDATRLRLTDHTGAEIPLPPGKGITLCRCGHSRRKPFCDASHRALGWDGTLDPSVFTPPGTEPPKP